jgi:hypothetical protein
LTYNMSSITGRGTFVTPHIGHDGTISRGGIIQLWRTVSC